MEQVESIGVDEFLRLFYDGTFDSDADAVEAYFTQFAIAARR